MLIGCLILSGCTTAPIGEVGFLTRESEPVGTKLLHPGVVTRSCEVSILGVRIGPRLSMDDAIEHVLTSDPEGNAVMNARLSWHRMRMIVYDRDCLEVRGDLVRTIATITIPHPGRHEHEAQ